MFSDKKFDRRFVNRFTKPEFNLILKVANEHKMNFSEFFRYIIDVNWPQNNRLARNIVIKNMEQPYYLDKKVIILINDKYYFRILEMTEASNSKSMAKVTRTLMLSYVYSQNSDFKTSDYLLNKMVKV